MAPVTRYSTGQTGVPGTHPAGRDLPDRKRSEGREQVATQQRLVELEGARPEIGTLAQPSPRIRLEGDGGVPRVNPVTSIESPAAALVRDAPHLGVSGRTWSVPGRRAHEAGPRSGDRS